MYTHMKHSLQTGISFGLTSGIITTLGLIIGLHAGTHSRTVVIGGILTIAIADSFSDALGIHIAEEAENIHTDKEIWVATIATFLSKFLFTLTFIIPLMVFSFPIAIKASLFWGGSVLTIISYVLAKMQKKHPLKIIGEHLFIGTLVVFLTHFVGIQIAHFLK